MILVVFIVSIFWAGFTQEIVLVLELFLLSLLLSITNYIFETITSLPLIYNYIVKYLLVSCIVILFGFIVGWFYRSNFFTAFIYVAIVFVLAYILDLFITKKDINYINSKIKERENSNN